MGKIECPRAGVDKTKLSVPRLPVQSLNATGQVWVIEKINDINDFGVIVGSGFKNGARRAVLLTSVAN